MGNGCPDDWCGQNSLQNHGCYVRRSGAYFGTGKSGRFDDPASHFGVCYLGTNFDSAFIETVYPTRPESDSSFPTYRYVTTDELRQRYLAEVRPLRPLHVARLVGSALWTSGIDLRITGGNDYSSSQAWSRAIYERRELVDGIVYPSRHNNQIYSVALFDRSQDAVEFRKSGALFDPVAAPRVWLLTQELCDRHKIRIIATPDHAPPV